MKKSVSFAVLLMACAGSAFADCDRPTAPVSIPDGSTAAMEEMMAAKKAVDAFKKDMEEYMTCERMASKIESAQKELVKVGQVTAESEKILSEVNDVLIANEAMAEKTSVRTVEEMMRDAGESSSSVSNPDTEAFLNS